MTVKIPAHCSLCDTACFEILQVQTEGDKYPGEPKRIGAPLDDSMRVTFWLFDGSNSKMTFCGSCAQSLAPAMYADLWKKCIRSWVREIDGGAASWLPAQLNNGILCELGRENWKDVING